MVQALRDIESCLFGDTKHRSYLTLLPPESAKPTALTPPTQDSGLRYLGYGLFEDRDRPPDCLPDGSSAKVDCILRNTGDSDPRARVLLASVWLWSVMGGLGARSRRGWGSVHISKIGGPDELVDPWRALAEAANDPEAHLTKLREGIGKVQDAFLAFFEHERLGREFLNNNARGPHPAIRTLDGITGVHSLRYIFPTGLAALEHAGQLFRGFRSTLVRNRQGGKPLPDYVDVKAALRPPNAPPRTVGRAAFGLPLRFYYRSLDGASTVFEPKPPGRKKADRLASPLLFRVYPLASGYSVALINLAGKPTAPPLQGCKLVASGPIRGEIEPPTGALIQDFINWATQQPAPAPAPNRR